MKAKIILFSIILLSSLGFINVKAQSRIKSVYGVNLGDAESVVTSKISGTWKTNSKGGRYYKTKNPTLGNCTFEEATFLFKNGKLSKVNFFSSDGGAMDPNFQTQYGGPNGYEQFLAKSERYQRMYRTMYSDLSGKYGNPVIDDGDRSIWKSNGNCIELKYLFEDNVSQYGFHEGFTEVIVSYYEGESTSSNF